jgi:hypothetical protein
VKTVVLPRPNVFRLRSPSIVRGILLSLGALVGTLRVAGFPDAHNLHRSNWQCIPVAAAALSLLETARCITRRWSLYHAGVLILLYSELMILAMALFFLLCPV